MSAMKNSPVKLFLIAALAFCTQLSCAESESAPPPAEEEFVSLFDGETLDGWTLARPRGEGYLVRDGLLICPEGGGGNLFTEKEYSDFIFRFEFRLDEGSNNGVGIRAPLGGDAAYAGMEIQILDDYADKYANLQPWQFHGSLYGVAPARRGALKPAGEWNQMEVSAIGRRIQVAVNDQEILDVDLDDVTDPEILEKHPGLQRKSGHVGFLGHNDYVEFRNIRIKDLSR